MNAPTGDDLTHSTAPFGPDALSLGTEQAQSGLASAQAQDLLAQVLLSLQASSDPGDQALVATLMSGGFSALGASQVADLVQRVTAAVGQVVATNTPQADQASAVDAGARAGAGVPAGLMKTLAISM